MSFDANDPSWVHECGRWEQRMLNYVWLVSHCETEPTSGAVDWPAHIDALAAWKEAAITKEIELEEAWGHFLFGN